MKEIIGGIAGLAVLIGVIYGCYYVGKNVSYSLFYEDMVIDTIKETVVTSALKK